MSTLCDPIDYVVHGILQARILEWVAFPFSRGSPQPRDQTQIFCIAGRFFTSWATQEAPTKRKLTPQYETHETNFRAQISPWHHVLSFYWHQIFSTDWGRKWQPTPVFLPEKFHAQGSLEGYSSWVTEESDTPEHAHAHLAQTIAVEYYTESVMEEINMVILSKILCEYLSLGALFLALWKAIVIG